jgi:hypothetical protein
MPDAPKPEPVALGQSFDPTAAGEITGRVVWQGDVPQVAAFRAPVNAGGAAASGPRRNWPNPLAPIIHERSRGVAGAVVFLRQVDPKLSRPWNLPPVRVEMRDYDYRVRQGDVETRTGFVRRGDTVEFVSLQAAFHSVRGRGDAFFTLALADEGRAYQRTFDRPGVVELSSAAGYVWARAHLFVAEHPYYARTDRDGRFTLPQVPGGDYEVVCWLPDWREKERELDGDTWQITRLKFRPPVEEKQQVDVNARRSTEANFTMTAAQFGR